REIDRVVPPRAFDLILVPETAVEPNRAVERAHLVDQVVRQFSLECLCIRRRGEVASLFLTRSAQSVSHAPDKLAHRLLRATLSRKAGLPEVLAYGYVRGELRPARGDFRVVHLEDDFAIGAGDLRWS